MSKKGGGGASKRGSHRLATAAGGCETKWYYSHWVKLEGKGGNYYTDMGTLLHTAVMYVYAEKMERKPQWYIDYPDKQSAYEIDSAGHPDWVRRANEFEAAYRRFEASDPWHPLYCEEQFEAAIGKLDPGGDDEPAEDLEYTSPTTGEKTTIHLPTLNEEVITCRPDLIVKINGDNWLVDHKSGGAARDGTGKLPVFSPERPDYSYYWQAMVNLHIVRSHIPIRGFIFNRMKREIPYDFSRDLFDIPDRAYARVPAMLRAAVKDERDIIRKIARGEKLRSGYFECQGKWGPCAFARLCFADSIEARNNRMLSEFDVV